jgi:hypothetical protein
VEGIDRDGFFSAENFPEFHGVLILIHNEIVCERPPGTGFSFPGIISVVEAVIPDG